MITETWTYTYDADGLRTKATNGHNTYEYTYDGGKLTSMTVDGTPLYFFYDGNGKPMFFLYNGTRYFYATNLQGDVTAIVSVSGVIKAEYTYDAWGNILSVTGANAATIGRLNPLRYRGYVYDQPTGLYYLQSRYYNPNLGRFLNADALVSTGQGLLGYNMFAYCNNNSVCFLDPTGYALCDVKNAVMNDGSSAYGANIAFLMAFFGVDSPDQVPELPDGAMIFVENIKSFSFYGGAGVVVGQTIVMDAHKYCEYTFIGVGFSYSKSIPLDVTVSQGYVYGVKEVSDYSGLFVGWAFNKLSSADGGAVALNKVYSQITGGMSYAVSLGGSVTWYSTSQTGWTYGRANMVILPNPYNTSPDGTSRSV